MNIAQCLIADVGKVDRRQWSVFVVVKIFFENLFFLAFFNELICEFDGVILDSTENSPKTKNGLIHTVC